MKVVEKLADLVPDDIFVGTSLVLGRSGRFLYGIRPVKLQDGKPVLELTGIGGGLESEDASFWAGAKREAREEIGVDVAQIPSRETLIVHSREQVEKVAIGGEERPLALVFRYHRTPPHRPWHPDNQGPACLIVFLGRLLGEAQPTMELPWLIWLQAGQLLESARRDVSMGELLAGGAELVPGAEPDPPAELVARLTDSQEALALALGDRFIDLYQSFDGTDPPQA